MLLLSGSTDLFTHNQVSKLLLVLSDTMAVLAKGKERALAYESLALRDPEPGSMTSEGTFWRL